MFIEARMPKSLDIGDWFPEDDNDLLEDRDVIIKLQAREAYPPKPEVIKYPVPKLIGMFNSGSRNGSVMVKEHRHHRCMLCSRHG